MSAAVSPNRFPAGALHSNTIPIFNYAFKLLLAFLFIAMTFIAHAQVTRKKQKLDNNRTRVNKPYVKDTTFIKVVGGLKYDSVKIFSFNCQGFDWNGIYKIDPSKLYYKVRPGHPFFDDGKFIDKGDTDSLIHLIKYSYKDVYLDDPVSPYAPNRGIAFFYMGKICAHIEISLATENMKMYVTQPEGNSLYYEWAVLGIKMRYFLTKTYIKYKMPCVD